MASIPDFAPYALEIKTLLKPDGVIRDHPVLDVEGVPTAVFVGDGDNPLPPNALDDARKRIWNQNLATVVIEVKGDQAMTLPACKLRERLSLQEARPAGSFSALDVVSANLSPRTPSWYDVKARFDRKLLANLSIIVARRLSRNACSRKRSELFEGQGFTVLSPVASSFGFRTLFENGSMQTDASYEDKNG
ncbi:hypothetical protein [Bradyrhizobium sp. LA7.1]|uniref:hypothetical protein n=1 Tax=Bradyrhizobium sp. LA7.1 TaxID=3156324 RepID=UPI003390DA48